MIDLENPLQRGRLFKAVKSSREAFAPHCRVREILIEDYVGSWYRERGWKTGPDQQILANLLNQTARIYSTVMAFNNPAAMVTPRKAAGWPLADRFELALNTLIGDMALNETFQAVVLDAFFSIGIVCVQMGETDTRFHGMLEAGEDVWYDPGEPWVQRIPPGNAVLDLSATCISKMRYSGHLYRADYEKVMDEPAYNRAVTRKLTPTPRDSISDPDRATQISNGGMVEDDELKPMVWMLDLWLPENKSVATFAFSQADGKGSPPLIEREWTGWQGGPYKYLGLGLVPDNMMPSAPAQNLKGLHDLQNRLHRKMARQSDNQRTVNAFRPGGEDDADRLRNAKDGEWVKVNDPESVKQVVLGGVDPGNQAFSMNVQEEYDRFAGNLRAMGGLGAQAGTLGQEEIIQENVSRIEAGMQLAVVTFATEVVTDLAYLLANSETARIDVTREVQGTGIYEDMSWPPEDQNGNTVRIALDEHDIRIEPYSMVYKTPAQKLNELFATLNQIAPLWPMFQASGASLDVEALVEMIAKLQGRPDLTRLITFAAPAGELGGDQNTVRSPAVTTRNNVRRNIPTGGTPENRSMVMQQMLQGQATPQQAASMTRAPA